MPETTILCPKCQQAWSVRLEREVALNATPSTTWARATMRDYSCDHCGHAWRHTEETHVPPTA